MGIIFSLQTVVLVEDDIQLPVHALDIPVFADALSHILRAVKFVRGDEVAHNGGRPFRETGAERLVVQGSVSRRQGMCCGAHDTRAATNQTRHPHPGVAVLVPRTLPRAMIWNP